MANKQIKNLYELARSAKDSHDWSTAARYYQDILYEDPKDWEATFYVGLNDATNCTLAQFSTATDRLRAIFQKAIRLVDLNDEQSAKDAIEEMSKNTIRVLSNLKSIAMKHHIQYLELQQSKLEYSSRRTELSLCASGCAASIDRLYGHRELQELSVNLYLYAIDIECETLRDFPVSSWDSLRTLIDGYVAKVQKYRPDYKNPVTVALEEANSKSSGGCYVATCVYGSYDCPQVWTLRRYRDNTLATTWYGRAFIRTYYAISPTLVKWFGNTSWFKKCGKESLTAWSKSCKARVLNQHPTKIKTGKIKSGVNFSLHFFIC